MGIVLVVLVVLALIAVTVPVWKGYESELRRNSSTPSASDSVDTMVFSDAVGPSPAIHTSTSHAPHHPDLGCPDSHHTTGCDVGGHGGFDRGGHH
jgi:hypothetical protein